MKRLMVARRFRGPSTSANGGYICGVIAALLPGASTVRLLKPPPLEIELVAVERDGGLEVRHGEQAIARARPGGVGDLVPPAAPAFETAVSAAARYAGFSRHPAPECFVCGPQRAPGDGLRIFCGAVDARASDARVVAAPWAPDPSLDGGDGRLAPEFVWAALDCPGYAAVAPDMRPMLLGELAARIDRRVQIGERCVVIGWPIATEGRKHEVGTALYGAHGDPCAIARGVWIEPNP